MLRLLLATAALAVTAGSAHAGAIIYATAGSQARVDGFCLGSDGAITGSPAVRQGTASNEPRRLKVVRIGSSGSGQVLYVAERHRIEVFSIGAQGFLNLIGSTPPLGGMDPRDFWVDTERLKLYVPQRGFSRIVAYDLDADGAPLPSALSPEGGFSSCIQGMPGAGYLDVWVDATLGLLYVTADGGSGRIEIHNLGADGGLVDPDGVPILPEMCRRLGPDGGDRPLQTPPLSEWRKLQNPKALIIRDGILYVEERFRKRITSFQLTPEGTFCPLLRTKKDAKNFGQDCNGFHPIKTPRCTRHEAAKGRRQQCPASRTSAVLQYEGLTLLGDTLIGAQFFRGRVDSYRLRPLPEGGPRVLLPLTPTQTSSEDPRMTPVGLTATTLATLRGAAPDSDGRGVVYVAAGEFDRVIAYRLDATGVLDGTEPFSRTGEQRGSFPNDVAIAVLPDSCT